MKFRRKSNEALAEAAGDDSVAATSGEAPAAAIGPSTPRTSPRTASSGSTSARC